MNGYTAPKRPPKTTFKEELRKNNAMGMDIILHGLPDPVRNKVGKCTSTKEIWNMIQNLYTKGFFHQKHEANQNESSNTKNNNIHS